MPVKKTETKVDIKNLDELITLCKDLTVEHAYSFERAKNPKNKRLAKQNARFWGSMAYYLGLVEEMTDDEVLQLEDRIKAKKGGEDA